MKAGVGHEKQIPLIHRIGKEVLCAVAIEVIPLNSISNVLSDVGIINAPRSRFLPTCDRMSILSIEFHK
jgi:hypothetical protein